MNAATSKHSRGRRGLVGGGKASLGSTDKAGGFLGGAALSACFGHNPELVRYHDRVGEWPSEPGSALSCGSDPG